MKIEKIECSQCGIDLTRTFRHYDNQCNAYCYDCWAERNAKRKRLRKKKSNEKGIVTLYREGFKVSEISQILGVDPKDIYEILTDNDFE